MSEREFNHSFENEPNHKPNLLNDFDHAVNAIMEIEATLSKPGPKDKYIIRDQMAAALEYLNHALNSEKTNNLTKKYAISGFQGLGGWNRYSVYSDGTIGLKQSHTTHDCIIKAQELGIDTPEF